MASRKFKIRNVQTEIIINAKFFNAGIRKSTSSFIVPHFVEIAVQAVLYSINLKDAWILIGGDGRVYSKDIIERIVQVLAGNSVRKVFVCSNGNLPTPVAPYLLRLRNCHFGFIVTAGHLPPGDNGYIGLRIISPPGIPIRKEIIDTVNRILKSLQSYFISDKFTFDFSHVGETEISIVGNKITRQFSIEVIDIVSPYVEAIKKMFNFPSIKDYIRENLKLLISCSGGVTGLIVKRIFIDELGVSENQIINSASLEDFGKLSSDPSQRTCKEFVRCLQEEEYQFGAVINPEGCRCLIVGEDGFVVSPSDSLAIIAEQHHCIPFFQESKLEAIFRTICTSRAVDRVADRLSVLRFEVPVGWENFSSALMPAIGKTILFGEESYGIGASSDNFCGDRDGIWTILAWLSIVSSSKKSVKAVTENHWKTFGRSFFGRLDFRNISPHPLDAFMSYLRETNSLRFDKIKCEKFARIEYIDPIGIDPKFQTTEAKKRNTEIVFDIENYVHPYGFIKKSLLRDDKYQNYQINLMDSARLIVRRSESISNSSTLCFYIEYRVEPEDKKIFEDREAVMKPFIDASMKITKIRDFLLSDMKPIFT